MGAKQCPTFQLTQNGNSTTVSLFRITGKNTGFWKSDQPGQDFRDTGHGNQYFELAGFGVVSLFNDIGQTDSVGQGHTITIANAEDESRVLTFHALFLDHLKTGTKGPGAIFRHSHLFQPSTFEWEYTGMQYVSGWQTTDADY